MADCYFFVEQPRRGPSQNTYVELYHTYDFTVVVPGGGEATETHVGLLYAVVNIIQQRMRRNKAEKSKKKLRDSVPGCQ